jgi:hypothetical protein
MLEFIQKLFGNSNLVPKGDAHNSAASIAANPVKNRSDPEGVEHSTCCMRLLQRRNIFSNSRSDARYAIMSVSVGDKKPKQ